MSARFRTPSNVDAAADRARSATAAKQVIPLVADPETRQRLIDEHASNPIGKPGTVGAAGVAHSPELVRLVDWFRAAPVAGKYVLLRHRSGDGWQIGKMAGEPGVAPAPVSEERYETALDAEHAIFLKRVAELVDSHVEQSDA